MMPFDVLDEILQSKRLGARWVLTLDLLTGVMWLGNVDLHEMGHEHATTSCNMFRTATKTADA